MTHQSFEIDPHSCAGEIRLGQPRHEVRAGLGSMFVEFRKTIESKNSTDHYEQLGVLVYYDADNLVEAIEFALPANVQLYAMSLLTMPCRAVTEHVRKFDPTLVLEDDGFISRNLGIGSYMPNGPLVEHEFPESILIFGQGYYD